MEKEELINKYAYQIASNKIEYSELHSILEQQLLNPSQVAAIKLQIDDAAQNIILHKNENSAKKQQAIQGIILFSLGAGITVASFLGLGVFASTKVYFISTGLMGFGGFSFFKSKKKETEKDPKKRMKRYFEKK